MLLEVLEDWHWETLVYTLQTDQQTQLTLGPVRGPSVLHPHRSGVASYPVCCIPFLHLPTRVRAKVSIPNPFYSGLSTHPPTTTESYIPCKASLFCMFVS